MSRKTRFLNSKNPFLSLFSEKNLKKGCNRFWKWQEMEEKYRKSRKQLQKEMERRRKLRELILNVHELYTQAEWARVLGCSQATVSRDLKKLKGTRWDPVEKRYQRIIQAINETLEARRQKLQDFIKNLSDTQLIALLVAVNQNRAKKRGP